MLCEQTYSRAGMSQHLKACRKKVGLQRVIGAEAYIRIEYSSYHIAVEDRYDSRYWLHLEMPMNLDLRALDRFLRDIWLECCGHLSSFRISEVTYRSLEIDLFEPFGGRPPENMQFAGYQVLHTGRRFSYEYDFGTTTELALRVVSEQAVKLGKSIRLVARNDPPRLVCHSCKSALAAVICIECSMDSFPSLDRGHLCIDCSTRHDCDDMVYLPVVNSPRVGMCGYMG